MNLMGEGRAESVGGRGRLWSCRGGKVLAVSALALAFSTTPAAAVEAPKWTSAISAERPVQIPGRKSSAVAPPEWAAEPVLQESTEFGKTSFRVGLRWNKGSDAIAYSVYRSTISGQDYELLANVQENQFLDTAVAEGVIYFYVVTALNADFQESERSPERSVTVRAGKRPDPKPRLSVVPRPTTLLWRVSDASGAVTKRGLDGVFGDAFDLAYDRAADLLYASSTFNRRVVVLRGSDGAVLRQLGPRFGGYEIGLPLGLGLDAQGRLHIVDARGSAIVVLARDGELLRVVPVPRQPGGREQRLIDVAVGPDGTAFVTDAANGQVIAVGGDGRELWRWGGEGGGSALPVRVTRIAATADGRLAVIDGLSQKIHLLSLSGAPRGAFGERKASVDGFLFLSDLAPLEDGHLLVAEQITSTVREYRLQDESGAYVANLANEKRDAGIRLVAPLAIAGDGKDRLFVLDDWGGRVGAYHLGDPAGAQPR